MKFQKLTINDYKTSVWSGGTTTELAIYSQNASYSERSFLWRISSAKVDLEKSTFTSLPGVRRIIMPLDGELKLHHVGQREVCLQPFEQDSFPGEWTTDSEGKVQDFNVMLKDDVESTLEHFMLKAGEELNIVEPGFNSGSIFLYCFRGELETIHSRKIVLQNGESLLVSFNREEEIFTLKIKANNVSDILLVRINY